jgi:hypothetical protein
VGGTRAQCPPQTGLARTYGRDRHAALIMQLVHRAADRPADQGQIEAKRNPQGQRRNQLAQSALTMSCIPRRAK